MTPHDKARSGCPIDQLEWYVNQTLSPAERQAVAAHLTECDACRAEAEAWTELRQAMRAVSTRTPQPRANLFAQIEHQLDLSLTAVLWSHLDSLVGVCWLALRVCGEHVWVQARLIRRDLFLVPWLLLPLAGWMVYVFRVEEQVPDAAILLAVLVSALGKAFLYGQEVDPPREMILATPTSPRLVLGIRCCLVLGYDLLINCGLVLPFLAWQGVITAGWFVESWLAPIFCLSAAALLLSTLFNSGTAVVACVLLWMLRLLDYMQIPPGLPWQQSYEYFWHQGPLLFVAGLLAVLLAFTLLERKERFA